MTEKNLRGSEFLVFPQTLWQYVHTEWKNRIFSLTEKIFREINSLVTSLIKTLLLRNFCQNCMRENLCYFHTVCHEVWKNKKYSLTEKIFREFNSLGTSSAKISVSFTLHCINYSHLKIILWNQILLFTKIVRAKFCNWILMEA